LPIVAALTLFAAQPSQAADAENGLALAQQWCNACHSIGNEEPRQEDAGPIWSDIADRHGDMLLAALDAPHDFMPKFPSLTDTDKADIVAYIQSLAGG
jgi:mono/diheme cytochrome c family protein